MHQRHSVSPQEAKHLDLSHSSIASSIDPNSPHIMQISHMQNRQHLPSSPDHLISAIHHDTHSLMTSMTTGINNNVIIKEEMSPVHANGLNNNMIIKEELLPVHSNGMHHHGHHVLVMNNNHHQIHDNVGSHGILGDGDLGDELEDHSAETHHHQLLHGTSADNSPSHVGMDRPTVVSISS